MIPLWDDNPTLRTPIVTIALLVLIGAAWLLLQGAGFSEEALAASVCNLGLIPGEITGLGDPGAAVPIAPGMLCALDQEPINWLTPLTSMFLHGGWAHLLGNALFLWVFGNNVEDSMGRFRFVVFYLLCGLAAAAAQVLWQPSSPVPMVGASGAISGVMGAYLVLYPRARVNMLFIFIIFIRIIPVPAWLVLIWWFVLQAITALPEIAGVGPEVAGGVAVFAHIGGFVAGVVLIKLFENKKLYEERTHAPRRGRPREHGFFFR